MTLSTGEIEDGSVIEFADSGGRWFAQQRRLSDRSVVGRRKCENNEEDCQHSKRRPAILGRPWNPTESMLWSATAVSVAVTAVSFTAVSWPIFVIANVMVALTYATIGVLVGALFGRLGGRYLLLLLPFIDIGLAQNAMYDIATPAWGRFLPSHGAVKGDDGRGVHGILR
jgi:hypothetical protein